MTPLERLSQAAASLSVNCAMEVSCLTIRSQWTAIVNALSGSVTGCLACAASGSPKSTGDGCEPASQLCGFRATEIEGNRSIDPRWDGGRNLSRRRHEAGPVQTEAAHNEPGQRIELNAGLTGLEADDRVGGDTSCRCEGLEADSLTLAFLAQARGDASRDGPHRLPRRQRSGSEQRSSRETVEDEKPPGGPVFGPERLRVAGRRSDDIVASEEAGGLDQLH
jgi:hypothetical protein